MLVRGRDRRVLGTWPNEIGIDGVNYRRKLGGDTVGRGDGTAVERSTCPPGKHIVARVGT